MVAGAPPRRSVYFAFAATPTTSTRVLGARADADRLAERVLAAVVDAHERLVDDRHSRRRIVVAAGERAAESQRQLHHVEEVGGEAVRVDDHRGALRGCVPGNRDALVLAASFSSLSTAAESPTQLAPRNQTLRACALRRRRGWKGLPADLPARSAAGRGQYHPCAGPRRLARRLEDLRHDQVVLERRQRVGLARAAHDRDQMGDRVLLVGARGDPA